MALSFLRILREVIDELPPDSYVSMNVKNFQKYEEKLLADLRPQLESCGGDFVTFKNMVISTEVGLLPKLRDGVVKDNPYLNYVINFGKQKVGHVLHKIFESYYGRNVGKGSDKPITPKCVVDPKQIKLLGPITSDGSGKSSIRWHESGRKWFKIAIPEPCRSQLTPLERSSLYVMVEPDENRAHFPEGLPDKLRGQNLTISIYLQLINILGYITSSRASSAEIRTVYNELMTNPKYKDDLYVLALHRQVLIIDKRTNLNVKEIFNNFINNKGLYNPTDQKFVKASPDLISVLGNDYHEWVGGLSMDATNELVRQHDNLTPEPGDVIKDVGTGLIYNYATNILDKDKVSFAYLIGDNFKDIMVDMNDLKNFKVVKRLKR